MPPCLTVEVAVKVGVAVKAGVAVEVGVAVEGGKAVDRVGAGGGEPDEARVESACVRPAVKRFPTNRAFRASTSRVPSAGCR